MKKKSVSLIIGLMSIALLGVIAMQVFFLRESYQLKGELFDQAVNESLGNVVSGLQKQEALYFFRQNNGFRKSAGNSGKTLIVKNLSAKPDSASTKSEADRRAGSTFVTLIRKDQKKADSIYNQRVANLKRTYPTAVLVGKMPLLNEDEQDHVQIKIEQFEDANGIIAQGITGQIVPARVYVRGDRSRYRNTLPSRADTIEKYLFLDSLGRPSTLDMQKPVIRTLTAKARAELDRKSGTGEKITTLSRMAAQKLAESASIVQKEGVFNELAKQWQSSDLPFKSRIVPLDSLLRTELLNHGIKIPYTTIIDSAAKAKSIFYNTSEKGEVLPGNVYKTALFPGDFMKSSVGSLTLIFPEKDTVILAKMGAMMGGSAALSLVLMCCFGYTLYSILRQKKIAEMKTDFINNMTHEFKTPVSTIMIASEGLKDPDVSADKSRVARLAGIIYDENVRLANHIERVLNIAKIDGENLQLEHKPVEMNDLISAVTDSMALQLQRKNATVTLRLDAANPVVPGDELHLSNVLYNLVDNAIKYSPEAPQIAISTLNTDKQLVIKISDKGIGMSRDQLSKIFEQFYRIPTGNLHDVKGFGLGLSYVNNIVKRLNGSVKVKSEKDKGSEFELIFPLI